MPELRQTPSIPEAVGRFLERAPWQHRQPMVLPLTGDASDRRYFRVKLGDTGTIVLAVHAGPIEFATLPFVSVSRLLQQVPLPVPAILDHDDALGVIALEDLGDVTLQARLVTADAGERMRLYREAVGFIAVMQRRGRELADDSCLPYTLAFDTEKLTWELDFFVRHFLEAHRSISLTAAERDALAEEFLAIASELSGETRVLCHRDYHSRNLMVTPGGLQVIDFQDARLGPDTYDLASLLRDSYVGLNDDELEALLAAFLESTATQPGDPLEFRRRFDLMSVQRNLKALGTFGFQATSRGNQGFVQYIPRTLGYVSGNLKKYPRFARLGEILGTHIPEIG